MGGLRRHGFAAAVVAVVVGLTLNCGDGNPVDQGQCSGTNSVSVGNNFFSPGCVQVSGSGTVTWTWNSAGVAHDVTFQDGQGNSQRLQTSGTHQRAMPAAAGTFKYRCTIHSSSFDDANGMIGRVVVQ